MTIQKIRPSRLDAAGVTLTNYQPKLQKIIKAHFEDLNASGPEALDWELQLLTTVTALLIVWPMKGRGHSGRID